MYIPQYLLRHFCMLAKNWFLEKKSSDNSPFLLQPSAASGSFGQIMKEVKTENHTGAELLAKKLFFLHLI